nr:hypothetical protein CFP56_02446 [Quercus suber]
MGNSSLEAAIEWVIDHENDSDIDQMPLTSLPLKSVTNAEQLRECLRSLKRNHQDRVGNLRGGMEFLELYGFERTEGDESLYLPDDKVDMEILNTVGSELKSAMTNPFFGILSV